MMFQFAEGATVALKANDPALDLNAGTPGTVWALYNSSPPSYEVTFVGKDGEEFDVTMSEEELTVPSVTRELAGSGHSQR